MKAEAEKRRGPRPTRMGEEGLDGMPPLSLAHWQAGLLQLRHARQRPGHDVRCITTAHNKNSTGKVCCQTSNDHAFHLVCVHEGEAGQRHNTKIWLSHCSNDEV